MQVGAKGPGKSSERRMSLVGKLEDLSLGEILQIVSLSQRSGILRLEGPPGEARVYISAGKIVHAAKTGSPEGVVGLLSQQGLLTRERAEELREGIRGGLDAARLRETLRDRMGVSPLALEAALKKRIEEIIYSLFLWDEGTFSFELVDQPGEEADFQGTGAFFLSDGINAQFVVMEGLRRKDELGRGNLAGAQVAPEVEGEEVPMPPGGGLQEEVALFTTPREIPPLPEAVAPVAVLISDDAELQAALKALLEARGVALFSFPDAAGALTQLQELRTQRTFPVLLPDLNALPIADGVRLGGLEIVSTIWDFGFALPTLLLARGEVPERLEERIRKVKGVELFRLPRGGRDQEVLQPIVRFVEGWVAPAAGIAAGGGKGSEEFIDLSKDFSGELAELDLPLETLTREEPSLAPQDPGMDLLRSYVDELNRPDSGGEITLLALRFASEFACRAVLFLVRREDLKGLGQFGVDLGPGVDSNEGVRSLAIPLVPGSLFSRVVEHQRSYRGKPQVFPEEQALFQALRGVPGEIYLGPVVSMGKTAVLLYGDDFPDGGGVPSSHSLDIFLSHVGLALDRAFLEMKLKSGKT